MQNRLALRGTAQKHSPVSMCMDHRWVVRMAVIASTLGLAMVSSRAVAQTTIGTPDENPAGLLPPVPEPPENPITEEKRVLGKILFWDEQLSSGGTMACGTCHIPGVGGIDPREGINPGLDGLDNTADDKHGSIGVVHCDSSDLYEPIAPFGLENQITPRNAPPAIMAMYAPDIFWDGRATSQFTDPQTGQVSIVSGGALESQSVGPPLATAEMSHEGYDWDQICSRLTVARPWVMASNPPADVAAVLASNPTYPELFEAAFGPGPITAEHIAYAIATYERTLVPDQTPLDRFFDGDNNAMTPEQQMGMNIFLGSTCAICHAFPLFTDNSFRNIGVRPIVEDPGRQNFTGNPADRGKFKTPTLRNLSLRPRFMHNGMFQTIEQVFDFYAHRNGQIPFTDNLDPLIQSPIAFPPMQQSHLTDFLMNALTDPRVASETFPFDRPTLNSERAVPNPEALAGGNSGSGGIMPGIIADRPPYLGNQWFQLGVKDALGGAQAILAISTNPPVNGQITADEQVGPMILSGSGVGMGYGTARYPIALKPSLDGQVLYMQWIIDDPQAQGGKARTPPVKVTLFCGNGQCFCEADFNHDGSLNTQDMIAFLNAWNAHDLLADTNRDGVINTQDVLAFLNRWTGGC